MKKKIISIVPVLLLTLIMAVFVSFGITVSAETVTDSETGLVFDTDTGEITDYIGDGGDLIIPSAINGVKVIGIDDSAFYDCSSLKSITIPNSITSIGVCAFYDCNRLTSISVDPSNSKFS